MRSCFLLLIACACATAAPPPKPAGETAATPAREPAATRIVSVLELRNKQQLRDGPGIDAGYVADRLRAEVLGAGIDARVISRENMLVMLQAQGKQLADCEGECEVETGRRIGADLVVSGEILRVGESLKASLRLHETRSGRLAARRLHISGADHYRLLGPGSDHAAGCSAGDRPHHRFPRRRRGRGHSTSTEEPRPPLHARRGPAAARRVQGPL